MTSTPSTEFEIDGHAGRLVARRWEATDPTYVVLLCHGYGEHVGRYEHVATRFAEDGAAVYAVDHLGHGRSDGERVLIEDFEGVVDDVRRLDHAARAEHPLLPVVLVGHSMGGMIGARYAQRFGADLACVVLSGPVIGRWDAVTALLAAEEIPDVPIDPDTLSRDPSVGRAYVADPLVWHGAFKRPTLEALQAMIDAINSGGAVEATPVLWLHGEDDQLVPIEASRQGWAAIAGARCEQKSYPGARHEIFNETNQDEVLADALAFIHRHLTPPDHPPT
jgi:alpha-beta hydrolase superfamily lysophospholipase